MDVHRSIDEFQKLISSVHPGSVVDFLVWIKGNIDEMLENVDDTKRKNEDIIIDSLREDLRQSLPINAVSPSEKISVPSVGSNIDCTPDTTVHVDAFLYDEDGIDELCEKGLMSRNYCANCGSNIVKPLTFITHSASVKQIKYIYQYILPDLRGKTILDVGSRTGAILYGAYVYSEASKIFGVEIDENFCQLQNNLIQKYGFSDRIQSKNRGPVSKYMLKAPLYCGSLHADSEHSLEVFHKDVMECQELLKQTDVIILNNVFEFFMPKQQQERTWSFLSCSIRKKDTVILTIPSIEESIEQLQTDININTWLKPADLRELCSKANMMYYGNTESDDSDLNNIHMYQVL